VLLRTLETALAQLANKEIPQIDSKDTFPILLQTRPIGLRAYDYATELRVRSLFRIAHMSWRRSSATLASFANEVFVGGVVSRGWTAWEAVYWPSPPQNLE